MKVIKRDGTTVDFDRMKIVLAVQKANQAVTPRCASPRIRLTASPTM